MSSFSSKRKEVDGIFEEDDIFDDSSFLANFDKTFQEKNKLTKSNLDDSANKSVLNVSALCCDEEISGYDKLTGRTWIYPTNYPVRDYQFNIIKAGILKNTLVSLPTGLGKTFIAAVIMYNFYRWYPLGKIVFIAPTRPLVAQQIDACYNIIAIPPNDTIEMTGHMQVNTRKLHWHSKRVFFATPQVIYNDIKSGICPADKIRCLVIDEAHRARGKYAYCQIVSTLTEMGHRTYRVLALSATPGSKVDDVINVVKNLHISHLELRSESSIDVAPYNHVRKINTVVIQLGPELTQLKQKYIEILDEYARRLKQLNILPHSVGNISKGRIVMLYKEYQTRERGARHPQHNLIMKDFTLLIALYHGLELLVKHGTRVFLNFFDEHPEKTWIQSDDKLLGLLERLRDDLGVNPLSLDRSTLPDGTIPEIPQSLRFGHPKFDKLKEIMLEHFSRAKNNGQDTSAIVFCEYRESVNLVHCLLLQCRPLITPQMFVGQGTSGRAAGAGAGAAVSQKQQARVMREFRAGTANALVATCVAEEGLDVGSVDLIVCFDTATASPVRLVQRCGRTGRERGGQVYILVTEGKEHQTLLDCIRQRDSLNKRILNSKEVENSLYTNNPRMLPHDFTPECQKMYITVAKKSNPKEKNKEILEVSNKGQKDLRKMLLGRISSSSSNSSYKEMESCNMITEKEFIQIFPEGFQESSYFEEGREYCTMNKDKFKEIVSNKAENNKLNLSTWLEWQRTLQKTINIGHSKDSEILAELLQYSDAKRFEAPPSTQNPTFNTQDFTTQNIISPVKSKDYKKKQKLLTAKSPRKSSVTAKFLKKSPNKKDGDIRALFSTATKSTKNYTKLINDLGLHSEGNIPTRFISLLVDLNLENTNFVKNCHVCPILSDCTFLETIRKKSRKYSNFTTCLSEPKMLDISLIDDINLNSIELLAKTNATQLGESDIKNNSIEGDENNCTKNFDLDFDLDSLVEFNSPEQTEVESKNREDVTSEKNFDIGDVEDIFAVSSPEEVINKNKCEVNDKVLEDPKDTLGFFGLNSIYDIFADSDDDNIDNKFEKSLDSKPNKDEIKSSEEDHLANYPLSPSILSGKQKIIHTPKSPILCSQVQKFQKSLTKQPKSSTPLSSSKKQLNNESNGNNNVFKIDRYSDNETTETKNTLQITKDKSMFTVTQLVDMINKTNDNDILPLSKTKADSDNRQRSSSPIILTQADRKKSFQLINNTNNGKHCSQKRNENIIILDSDSDNDLDITKVYEIENECSKYTPKKELNEFNTERLEISSLTMKEAIVNKSPLSIKRKLEDDDTTCSPYFNKKQKVCNANRNQITLQEKVLAALNKEKKETDKTNHIQINFMTSLSPVDLSQKENKNPQLLENNKKLYVTDDDKMNTQKKVDLLQMFRRDSKVTSPKKELESVLNNSALKLGLSQRRKITFDDSDDDFDSNGESEHQKNFYYKHNVKKKKRKPNVFLDLEAELSGDGEHSDDELSDDSDGSINDFICDDVNITNPKDMQAHYLRSVKSPVKGNFKIPELPKRLNTEIFSQFVEEDSYEMDSFCVDSNIGLTQVNEMSEIELAEMGLEENRRLKKKSKKQRRNDQENSDSPIAKRTARSIKRQINSDSDENSS